MSFHVILKMLGAMTHLTARDPLSILKASDIMSDKNTERPHDRHAKCPSQFREMSVINHVNSISKRFSSLYISRARYHADY